MGTKWYEKKGREGDIVLSTRIRFARNLADFPFPGKQLRAEGQREIIDKCAAVFAADETGKNYRLIDLEQTSKTDRQELVERHIISQDIAEGEGPRAVLLDTDESVSVMLIEEDHLRIQVMGAGLCLEEALNRAIEIDNIFDRGITYAFDENLGYLTKCPTNLGAGMRASVMLHLPALTESGAIRALAANAGKIGFAVRGVYGEGSAAKGALYQISNQLSLGFTEQTIIERLSDALSQIIEQERATRSEMLKRNKTGIEDRVWRAAGTLRYARTVSADEAMGLLSEVRLGATQGLIDLKIEKLNSLLWDIQPASLVKEAKKEDMPAIERDIYRAEYLRGAFEAI